MKQNKYFSREDLQIYLEKNNIQTRVIFSGNILKQPLMQHKKYVKVKSCDINSNYIMKNGILVGCHHGMKIKDLKYMINTFQSI